MFAKATEHGDYCYNNTLVGDNEEFQWSICLFEIVPNGVGNGLPAYETTNRKWQCVGPIFKSRSEGAKWLGYGGKGENVREHQDLLVEEYNSLYSDEIETREQFHPENKPKFGRPSQGRDRRLSFYTSAKVESWLESKKQGNEALSNVIHRILEERMQSNEKKGIKQMQEYEIDLSNLNEEQKGDVSQRLHELQETCLDVKDNVGKVYGIASTVSILQKEGYDVKLVSERVR